MGQPQTCSGKGWNMGDPPWGQKGGQWREGNAALAQSQEDLASAWEMLFQVVESKGGDVQRQAV